MRRDFSEYGPALRVEGGLKAQSTRGAIGESWWSRRFLAVLESFALGSRLSRGKNYARKGQVISLTVAPGIVRASVQGSRPRPYDVTVELPVYDEAAWQAIEKALAAQAIYTARLLAGDLPAEIEEVFAKAGAPLFPTSSQQLLMECSCPDWQVPCKHLAATFYLLAETFDADPFQILHWRGRGRDQLLARLRELRDGSAPRTTTTRKAVTRKTVTRKTAARTAPPPAGPGAAAALAAVAGPELADVVDRFWVPPVPLPARPPTLDTDVTLLLRQLPAAPSQIGGADLVATLRRYYETFHQGSAP